MVYAVVNLILACVQTGLCIYSIKKYSARASSFAVVSAITCWVMAIICVGRI